MPQEQTAYQEVLDFVEDFCEDNDIPYGEPNPPISVDFVFNALKIQYEWQEEAFSELAPPARSGITGAVAILNSVYSNIADKAEDAAGQLYNGGIGGPPSTDPGE